MFKEDRSIGLKNSNSVGMDNKNIPNAITCPRLKQSGPENVNNGIFK